MSNLQRKPKKNNKRRNRITLLIATTAVIGGLVYDDNWMKLTNKVVDSATVYASKKIDNHEYREIPWNIFMTEKDREILYASEIPEIPSLDLSEQDINEKIKLFDEMLSESEPYLTDRELFRESIDNKDKFASPINKIYNGDDAGDFYHGVLSDVYTKEHTYPDNINLVSINQRIKDDETSIWNIRVELNVLQDKEAFITHPLTLTFDEQGRFVSGKTHKVVESKAGTRPLTIDPLIEEDAHLGFHTSFLDFASTFNLNEETGKTDNTHLQTLVSETLPIEALEEIFEASSGDITNGSFVSWTMNDRGADALSYYRMDIPYNVEGDVLKLRFTYSRAYDEIQSIEII